MNKRVLWFVLLPLLFRPIFVFLGNWIPILDEYSIGDSLSIPSLALTVAFIVLHDMKTFPPRQATRMVQILKAFHAVCNVAIVVLFVLQKKFSLFHFSIDAGPHIVISAMLSVFIVMTTLKYTRVSTAKLFVVCVFQFIPILDVLSLLILQKYISNEVTETTLSGTDNVSEPTVIDTGDVSESATISANDASESTATISEPPSPTRKRPGIWLVLRFVLLVPSLLSILFVIRIAIGFYKDKPYDISYEWVFLALAGICSFLFTLSAIRDKNAVATICWSKFAVH